MCRDLKLRLIPIVIIVAAVFSGLIIFSNTPAGLFALFAAALGISFLTLLVTGSLAAVCGLQSRCCESQNNHPNETCFTLHCFGPIILITAIISVIISLLVIEGAFAAFTGFTNAILGIVAALIFSTMLVYFIGMFLTVLKIQD